MMPGFRSYGVSPLNKTSQQEQSVNPFLLATPGLVGFWFSSESARSQLRAKSCSSHSAPGGV